MSDSCDPMDYSPPGFSIRGILQSRILEWVAMPLEEVKRKTVVRNKCLFSTNESTPVLRHHFPTKMVYAQSAYTAITQGGLVQGLLERRARKRL